MTPFTESEIELLAIQLLCDEGYIFIDGPSIAPDEGAPGDVAIESERGGHLVKRRHSYSEIVLESVLADSVDRLNPLIPPQAREQALKSVLSIYSPQLVDANENFYNLLTHGVPVTLRKDGQERGEKVWLVDFQNPENNLFHVVNQFTVVEQNRNKRPDLVLFVNGLPLVVIELKNPGDEHATVRKAFDQIQTYKQVIPSLFYYNAFSIATDGLEARAGTISSLLSRFSAWKTIDGKAETCAGMGQLEVLIRGMLSKATLLDLVKNFIVFEKGGKTDTTTGLTQIETVKKLAAYHQYYAVNKAVQSTIKAASETGSRKAGVIWHTQGSGKSLSMVFYAGKLINELDNPTILVITDRNDLDQQLFDTFAASKALLGQEPVQADSREHLKSLLRVASGGIVFTTIQKFFPDASTEGSTAVYETLSQRKNIIVIADEAHRTQYGFKAKLIDTPDKTGKRVAYGFAKYLRDAIPNATFIGFTGTPVESTDVNTPAVFGNYIDVYDIAQAVADEATVKIYYESRLAKVNLTEEGRKLIEEFEEELEASSGTASEDFIDNSKKAKAKWTKLEAIVGHPKRLKNLAQDLVDHYEKRAQVFDGKAMIVAMSRRIAVALYEEIIKLKPEWHSDKLMKGNIKVVITSASSDKMEFDPEDPDSLVIPAFHRTNKEERRTLADRMKDPADPLKIVIVRDMWLTGFDVPCLHTMYIDKLMRGHGLMQAIARVNRIFLDKPGGLIVDYIGIGTALKQALAFYAKSGGRGKPAETQEQAVALLLEKIEVVRQMFHRFDFKRFFTADTSAKLSIILQAEEHVLGEENGKERFIKESTTLSKVLALGIPHPQALELVDEVAFFQAVRSRLLKFETGEPGAMNYETAIRRIVTEAVESTEVVDIFSAAGITKPDISLLSEEFLLEVKGMKYKNLAMELLKKILNDEIRVRLKFNIVEGKKLIDMLQSSIKKYQNNLLTTVEIIEELIRIAGELRSLDGLAKKLNLTEAELAFYSALEVNDSAVQVLGDETLKKIAREIAEKVRNNATIDWNLKESARAKLMVLVKRTLTKHGYPPDKQQKAIDIVLKQAEAYAEFWVA